MDKIFTRFSTYAAFIVWGTSGFVGQPTFAGGVVHFIIMPAALIATVWLARMEARP